MTLIFAVAALASTAGAVVALAWPQTDFAASTSLALVHERRADALAHQAPTREAVRMRAIRETQRSLAQAPANPSAWLRLAYLDSVSSQGLSPEGERALAASYVVAPYGPDVTTWRLGFALNHWPALSDATRRAVLDELSVTADASRQRDLKQVVSDPGGLLALRLTLRTMEAEKPRP